MSRKGVENEEHFNMKLLREQYEAAVVALEQDETARGVRGIFARTTDDLPPTRRRGAMGEHISADGKPLTSLAFGTPGPASYEPRVGISYNETGPQYSIQGSRPSEKPRKGPGPSDYDVRVRTVLPRFTLKGKGRSALDTADQDTPGPAGYHAGGKPFGSDAKAFTLASRHYARTDASPGPNQYTAADPWAGVAKGAKSFGIRPHTQPASSDVRCGPGDYFSDSLAVRPSAPAYSLRARLAAGEPPLPPGPGTGHYSVDSRLHRSQRAPSLKSRHADLKKMQGPGPATYVINADPTKTSPKYSMTDRNAADPPDIYFPGPTHYTPAVHCSKPSTPQHSLSARCTPSFPVMLQYPEMVRSKQAVPGPNSYYADSDRGKGPQFSMQGRYAAKADVTPGPADYKQDLPATLSGAPAFSMGSRIVAKVSGSNTAGPANYLPRVPKRAPKFSLGSRLPGAKAADTPAPNAYKVEAPPKDRGPAFSMKGRASPYVYAGHHSQQVHLSSMLSF